ncbi:MAG: hypothetical protein ACUVSS_14680 [Anaerolineae bacterium]
MPARSVMLAVSGMSSRRVPEPLPMPTVTVYIAPVPLTPATEAPLTPETVS